MDICLFETPAKGHQSAAIGNQPTAGKAVLDKAVKADTVHVNVVWSLS